MKHLSLIAATLTCLGISFLPAYGSEAAGAGWTSHPMSADMQVVTQPGTTTLFTTVDKNGKVTHQVQTAPESESQLRAKKKFMENAPQTYKLTVKSMADKTGNNAVPNVVFVMKDKNMFWRAEEQEESVFDLPEGTYNIQVVYSDEMHSIVVIPNVYLKSVTEISVNADMADKIVYYKMIMPDGSPMTLTDNNNADFKPNTSQVACHQVVSVNGCSQWTHSIQCSVGGNKVYTHFAVKCNFPEGSDVCWNALTWETAFGHIGLSRTANGIDLKNGDILSNEVGDYNEIGAEFVHTPIFAEKGNENTVTQMGINLYSSDNRIKSGFALSINDPKKFYICAPVIDTDTYYTMSFLQEMESYPKYGRKTGIYSPMIGSTKDGMQFMCKQDENPLFNHGPKGDTPEAAMAAAPFNPYFAYAMNPLYVMASTTPYAATGAQPATSGDKQYYKYSVSTYYGNYGENRFVDSQYYTQEAYFNGEPVDLSNFRDSNAWLEANATDENHTNGKVSLKYINSNAKVGDLSAKNECEITFTEGEEDVFPPTIQRMMFRNAEGVPTVKFNTSKDAKISIAGGDFSPVSNNVDFGFYQSIVVTYDYSPATVKVELAPNGGNNYTEITMISDSEKFVPTYGAYWEGSLENLNTKSENGWYDLRVTMTDEAGNTQVQTLTPAVYIEDPTNGIETVAEPICGFSAVDGKVIALDGSEVTVYSLSGVKMVNANLPKGLYVAVSDSSRGIITVK